MQVLIGSEARITVLSANSPFQRNNIDFPAHSRRNAGVQFHYLSVCRRAAVLVLLLTASPLVLQSCDQKPTPSTASTAPLAKAETAAAKPQLIVVGSTPVLQFKAYDGREVNLASLKGKVVLIDFWATWCLPCVKAMPALKGAYKKFHAEGLEIIGVSLDDEEAAFKKFLKDESIEWPQHYDGKGQDNKYANEFSLGQLPTLWLIDKKGKIRFIDPPEPLEDKIKSLLDEKN